MPANSDDLRVDATLFHPRIPPRDALRRVHVVHWELWQLKVPLVRLPDRPRADDAISRARPPPCQPAKTARGRPRQRSSEQSAKQKREHIHVTLHVLRLVPRADVTLRRERPEPAPRVAGEDGVDVADVAPAILAGPYGEDLEPAQ